jgi:hypothetical protein
VAAGLAFVAGISAGAVIAPFTAAAMLRGAAVGTIPAVDETSGLEVRLAAVFVMPADRLTPAVVVSLAWTTVPFTALHAIADRTTTSDDGVSTFVYGANPLATVGLVVTAQAVAAIALVT